MKRLVLAVSVAFAAALSCACVHAPAQAPAATFAATSVPLLEPRAGLYTAAQPAESDWEAIQARGVTTVINLRTAGEMQGRDEAAEVEAQGMRYINIPVAGVSGIDMENAQRLHDALASTEGTVLLHCASANRAGALLALEQAKFGGMDEAQALELGRKAGMVGTEARVVEVLRASDND